MKFVEICDFDEKTGVAPARERGLKLKHFMHISEVCSRSREGAWIEILWREGWQQNSQVAPARERGLKC